MKTNEMMKYVEDAEDVLDRIFDYIENYIKDIPLYKLAGALVKREADSIREALGEDKAAAFLVVANAGTVCYDCDDGTVWFSPGCENDLARSRKAYEGGEQLRLTIKEEYLSVGVPDYDEYNIERCTDEESYPIKDSEEADMFLGQFGGKLRAVEYWNEMEEERRKKEERKKKIGELKELASGISRTGDKRIDSLVDLVRSALGRGFTYVDLTKWM